jgi:predicted metal-binding protein
MIQVKSAGADKESLFKAERDVQLILGKMEGKALGLGWYFAAGLGAACCRMCTECVGARSGLPCRNPGQARPSAEAMGIDVIKTAEKAGIPFSLNNPDEVIYSGILLLD